MRPLSHTAHGWLYWPARRGKRPSSLKHQQRVIPGRNWPERPKNTGFTSHRDLHRFVRIPLGLKSAAGKFQHTGDVILARVEGQFVQPYEEDIVVFSKTPKKHIGHVCTVFALDQRAGIKLKLERNTFFADTINYLGHIIRPWKLEISSHLADAIKNLQQPRIITEWCRLLRLCNVFKNVFLLLTALRQH